MKKVGVIGLGNMGMGMAKNLIKSGFSVIGFDLDAKRLLKLKENGGSTATSTVQVGEETDAVFVMVMNGEQVKAVVADLVTGLKDRGTIILTATIRPEEAREAYSIADIEGVAMLDSPVSGGMDGAHNGTLTLMTAAKKSVFDDCIKILEAVSSHSCPATGLTARQLDVVEVHFIDQAANRKALFVGIVDAKAQHELLLEQPGLDDFNVFELNARIPEITAEPS